MSSKSYEQIKKLICNKVISAIDLQDLKEFFNDDIGSARRLACIQTISDLIYVLESQNILHEYDIRALEDIAGELDDKQIDYEIENYDKPVFIAYENLYAIQRIIDENNEDRVRFSKISSKLDGNNEKPTENTYNTSEAIEKYKKDVYKLIATEIGCKWRSFGRELGIRESEMDTLEIDYPRDAQTRVYKILETFENDKRRRRNYFVKNICDALVNSRRKDISDNVQNIINNSR